MPSSLVQVKSLSLTSQELRHTYSYLQLVQEIRGDFLDILNPLEFAL